jgi:putative NADPH-quinone reductase/1,4-dihydroxy-2-naphthoate octaprenyltransferase
VALRVLVILAHPRGRGSLCGALAQAYRAAAESAGAAACLVDLASLRFAPNVVRSDPAAQALEPGLARLKAQLVAADHLVFVYPTWWGTYPALLKGMLDRLLAPGFAFRVQPGGPGFYGLLRGRTAELITTMDTPSPVYRLIYGAPGHRALARATLGFCGIETTRITRFGPVQHADAATRRRWIEQARRLGASLASGVRSPAARWRRRLADWLAALRLQFYPLTFLAYALGALVAAAATPAGLDLAAFWLGYLVTFLIEAATVFTNDVFDEASDRRNDCYGPFTGGSRVLVDGRLGRRQLLAGAGVALAGAGAATAALLTVAPFASLLVIAIIGLLGLGYTVPPLRLSHRGLGELDVALTHSVGVILAGAVFQGAPLTAGWPWLLGLPLGLAVLPAITLAGIPDAAADAAAGKRTLAVRIGLRRAVDLALAATVAAVAACFVVRWSAPAGELLRGLPWLALAHGAWLAHRLRRFRSRARRAQRIDGLMLAALGFSVWFAAVPLLNLVLS